MTAPVRVAPLLVLLACAGPAPTAGPVTPATPPAPVAATPAPTGPACEEVARAAIRVEYPGETYPARQRLVLAACEVDGWSAAVRACVTAATTGFDAACAATVRAALAQKLGEADVALALAATRLQRRFEATGVLPTGSGGPVPATPCCEGRYHVCEPGTGGYGDVWDLLGVYPELAHYYRYSYESDGHVFTLRAVSDMDCDGLDSTFTLVVRRQDDRLEVAYDRPPRVD